MCQTIEETGNSITMCVLTNSIFASLSRCDRVPTSNEGSNAYMYVTKTAIQGLLKNAEINPDLSTLPSVNLTGLTQGDDPPPAGIVESDIALIGEPTGVFLHKNCC